MILRDTEGRIYRLNKCSLRTIKPLSNYWSPLFWIDFKDVKKADYKSAQLHTTVDGKVIGVGSYIRVSIMPEKRAIGCRLFSRSNFSKIMKAIRALKLPKERQENL